MNDVSLSSRTMAVRSLGLILGLGEQLETAIAQQEGYNQLPARDRAFVRLLVSSFFRHKGQIDKVLAGFVERKPPDYVMNALRIGAVQILVLGTSDHAAVGEMVDVVKKHKKYTKFSGLVNAVLRRLTREGASKMAEIAPRENIPSWIYRSWEKSYGRGSARAMALEFMKAPPLDITVKSDPDVWAERLGGEVLYGTTIRLAKAGQVQGLDGYEEGAWWVQDVASSLPVQLIGDVSGLKVLDMCAAPGGKALQLAAGGAEVTALDRSGQRLQILKDNFSRTGLDAEIVEADALKWDEGHGEFDIVLLDAPCSATGTYRRHPDVLYAKTARQMDDLQNLQKKLIKKAADKLKPGGTLIYATCSLQTGEGERQVDDFLAQKPQFSVIRPENTFWEPYLTKNGYFRLLPHQIREKGGLDGFFFAFISSATKKP